MGHGTSLALPRDGEYQMSNDDWTLIKQVFDAASGCSGADRLQWLDQATSGRPEIRLEVESLLAAHEQAQGFLDVPASINLSEPASILRCNLPDHIGKYRILHLIGQGGMGTVYEAEQEQPQRTVALKVIRPGLASPELVQRFQQESQALARLQHPGIAQIYDAGTADIGFGAQPYFAMELIRGPMLQDYAETQSLGTPQRLELLAKVCDAVHHAHQRGLIHRDLKPGNVLVDENGQPKILDFGIARTTDGASGAQGQTGKGQILGTLDYMSPEQVLGDPLEVDIRSDIYSLGIILYELLAGRPPYAVSTRLHEAARIIREEDPAPLSTVNRIYRGDIETIVGKALEKNKARRYGSAAELAADIRRYLKDEPIAARPPSMRYQLHKFARRHRAFVMGVVAVFLALSAGIIASTRQAIRARHAEQTALLERDRASAAEHIAKSERDRSLNAEKIATSAESDAVQRQNEAIREKKRADTEAAIAKAVNDFLQQDLLRQASASVQAQPGVPPDPDLKVRTALDRAAARIPGKFDKQPLVEASLRRTIGGAYRDLGLYGEAAQQLERELELRHRYSGENDAGTLAAMTNLGSLLRDQGKYAQAEPLLVQAMERSRRLLGTPAPETLSSMENLALLYRLQGKYPQAEDLLNRSVEAQGRSRGSESSEALAGLTRLAALYREENKFALAEPLLMKVLAAKQRLLGEDHPETLGSMNTLALFYRDQRRYPQAEELLTKVVGAQRRILGEEHPSTLDALNNLGELYRNQTKYSQAEPLFIHVLEVRRRVLGDDHPRTLHSIGNLAVLYQDESKFAQAEPLLRESFEVQQRVLGENHPDTVTTFNNLAVLYARQGKYTEAEPIFLKVLDSRRRLFGEEHTNTLTTMNNLGLLYRNQKKYPEAESFFSKVLEVRRRVLGEEHPNTVTSLNNLGMLYVTQARYAQAEPLLLSEYRIVLNNPTPENISILDTTGKAIIKLYQDSGNPEKAVEWRDKLQTDTAARAKKP
jgi:tetratricopeptide (TPR) repeat protein